MVSLFISDLLRWTRAKGTVAAPSRNTSCNMCTMSHMAHMQVIFAFLYIYTYTYTYILICQSQVIAQFSSVSYSSTYSGIFPS